MYLKAHGYWTRDYDIFTCGGRKGICFMWQKGHIKKWRYKFGTKMVEYKQLMIVHKGFEMNWL